jgi:hypothetical protein
VGQLGTDWRAVRGGTGHGDPERPETNCVAHAIVLQAVTEPENDTTTCRGARTDSRTETAGIAPVRDPVTGCLQCRLGTRSPSRRACTQDPHRLARSQAAREPRTETIPRSDDDQLRIAHVARHRPGAPVAVLDRDVVRGRPLLQLLPGGCSWEPVNRSRPSSSRQPASSPLLSSGARGRAHEP